MGRQSKKYKKTDVEDREDIVSACLSTLISLKVEHCFLHQLHKVQASDERLAATYPTYQTTPPVRVKKEKEALEACSFNPEVSI